MTAEVIPLDATAAIFGQGGALARSFPGCDPRLSTKGYGADIIRSLGMPTRTRSIAEACAWLARGVEGMRQTTQAVGAAR